MLSTSALMEEMTTPLVSIARRSRLLRHTRKAVVLQCQMPRINLFVYPSQRFSVQHFVLPLISYCAPCLSECQASLPSIVHAYFNFISEVVLLSKRRKFRHLRVAFGDNLFDQASVALVPIQIVRVDFFQTLNFQVTLGAQQMNIEKRLYAKNTRRTSLKTSSVDCHRNRIYSRRHIDARAHNAVILFLRLLGAGIPSNKQSFTYRKTLFDTYNVLIVYQCQHKSTLEISSETRSSNRKNQQELGW